MSCVDKNSDSQDIIGTGVDDNRNTIQDEEKKRTELKSFSFLVGGEGHQSSGDGVYDVGNATLLKCLQGPPHGTRELDFYQKVFDLHSQDEDIVELRQFLPRFYGVEQIGEKTYIKLENLTSGFKYPCVADVKMGLITYDPNANAAKKLREDAKWLPGNELGFRLTGFMAYDDGKPVNYKRNYCRSLTKGNIISEGFGTFLRSVHDHKKKATTHQLISKLQKIESWFKRQKKFSFYASSFLIVYEGINAISSQVDINSMSLHSGVPQRVPDMTQSSRSASLSIDSSSSIDKSIVTDLTNSSSDSICSIKSSTSVKRWREEADCFSIAESKRRKSENLISSCYATTDGPVNDTNKNSDTCIITTCDPHVEVHMIDFAHVFPATDTDHNYLTGLSNLIRSLQNWMESL